MSDILLQVLVMSSLFSVIGALVYLGLLSGKLPLVSALDWKSGVSKFCFSVGTGSATWLFTEGLFGAGTQEASLTAVATAAVVGGVTKFTDWV